MTGFGPDGRAFTRFASEVELSVLVVVDSYFGNTEQLGRVIGNELARAHTVRLARPSGLERLPIDVDLIVIGSPTHRHGVPAAMSDLLHASPAGSMPGTPAAVFDTRYRVPRLLSGASSDPIARRLRRLGCQLVLPPESFFVSGREGPLENGELERAALWASRVELALRRLPALVR